MIKTKGLNDGAIERLIKWLIYPSTDSSIAWLKIITILKRLNRLFREQCTFLQSNAKWDSVYSDLYNHQINARALIGQSAVGYCYYKPTEKSRVFWIII